MKTLAPLVAAALGAVVVACSSSSPSASSPSGDPPSANASDADGAADGAASQGTATTDAATEPLDADVPPTSAGLLMAVQGTPPPQPGKPTPFILVGCPRGGLVDVHAYILSDDGSKTDAGRHVGTYTKQGIEDRVDVGASLDIDVVEQNSFAVEPFVYRATVTADPAMLDTGGHTFVARMLNPASPGMNDIGVLFPEKLVQCP